VDWSESRAQEYENPGGRILLWVPAVDVVVTRGVGRANIDAVDWYTARIDRVMEGGRVHIFHHWADVAGYDAEARNASRAWAASRASKITETHFLVRSPILRMGISVASLALNRPLHAHSDAREFERLLDTAIADAPTRQSRGKLPDRDE
jgi:hypothetical protein